jgi:hypothetical protein
MQESNRQFMEQPLYSPLETSLALKVGDYVHPREVVQDDRLGPTEKRAILCAWASDACAVDSKPGFRWLRETPGPILVDHILGALRALDESTGLQGPRRDAPRRHQPGQYSHLFAQSANRGSLPPGIGR